MNSFSSTFIIQKQGNIFFAVPATLGDRGKVMRAKAGNQIGNPSVFEARLNSVASSGEVVKIEGECKLVLGQSPANLYPIFIVSICPIGLYEIL